MLHAVRIAAAVILWLSWLLFAASGLNTSSRYPLPVLLVLLTVSAVAAVVATWWAVQRR